MKRAAPRIGASLALVVTTAVVSLHHHNNKHPLAAVPSSGSFADVVPLRANRNHTRPAVRPSRSSLRVARPAGGSGSLSDVTMYCKTGSRNADGRWPEFGDVAVIDRTIPFGTRVLIDGNVYTVRDWVGWGSDFDIFGGNDAGCESRALDFGRRRLRVVVER